MTDHFPPSSLRPLLDDIASLLKNRKQTVSVAETAAGGLISASLLSVPGASAYYRGGLTVYTLESRLAFAGWTPESIAAYAGPTTEVVAGLAQHTRNTLQSDFAVAESGTAGPGPTGSGVKPNRIPGTVFVAVAAADGQTYTRQVDTGLGGHREGNMVAFAGEALKLLRDVLQGTAEL